MHTCYKGVGIYQELIFKLRLLDNKLKALSTIPYYSLCTYLPTKFLTSYFTIFHLSSTHIQNPFTLRPLIDQLLRESQLLQVNRTRTNTLKLHTHVSHISTHVPHSTLKVVVGKALQSILPSISIYLFFPNKKQTFII
jgi:hypothetical protein